MTDLLLAILALVQAPGVRVVPRPDGALLEIVSDSAMSPSLAAEGFTVLVRTGSALPPAPPRGSFWIESLSVSSDGTTLRAAGSPLVQSVDWALSADSLTLVVFFR